MKKLILNLIKTETLSKIIIYWFKQKHKTKSKTQPGMKPHLFQTKKKTKQEHNENQSLTKT